MKQANQNGERSIFRRDAMSSGNISIVQLDYYGLFLLKMNDLQHHWRFPGGRADSIPALASTFNQRGELNFE
jgi:hypothetical protein